MTGFGRGEARTDNFEVIAEIRSVNNRYFELITRLPRLLNTYEYEQELKALLRDRLRRGRVSVAISLKCLGDGHPVFHLDLDLARSYLRLLEELRESLGLKGRIRIEHLLGFSDIFSVEPDGAAAEQAWACAKEAVEKALEALLQMRREEGRVLQQDMMGCIARIEEAVQKIRALSERHKREEFSRLRSRLVELVDTGVIDPNRVEMEVAILVDRMDVTEECTRLDSHLGMFRRLVEEREPTGRRLNFLLQEMNREANTIGAKAGHAEISHLVVSIKEEIEKIREQVQNIE